VFYFLSQTSLGRALHAIGGNPQAARFCGLNTKGLTLVSFAICGLLTGVSGLLTSSRMAAGSPTIGIGWELQAIAVVVFGGASLLGGEGSILGTVFAGVLIGMINNWMSLAGMDWWLQGMVQGSLLIIVVILNQEALGRRSQRA
jgi:ribose transport system permease protein